jgi:hypothetical protein
MKRLTFFLALGLSAAALAEAPAPKKTVKLVYARMEGAGACPSPKQTEEAVSARLGYDPFRPDAKDVIEVYVSRTKAGLSAEMRLRDATGKEQGKRELESTSRDCGELASALQLAIAIAVDPQSFMGGPVTPPIPQAEALPPPPPPPALEATPEPEPSRVHLAAGAGLLGLYGSAPQPTGGAALRVSLAGERYSLALDLRADLPTGLQVGPGNGSVSTMTALLAPCVNFGFAGFCAVGGGGAVRVSSQGLAGSTDQTGPLFVAGARLQASWAFSQRFSLALTVDGLVPLTHTVLTANNAQVWSAPPVIVVGGLLLVVRLT